MNSTGSLDSLPRERVDVMGEMLVPYPVEPLCIFSADIVIFVAVAALMTLGGFSERVSLVARSGVCLMKIAHTTHTITRASG